MDKNLEVFLANFSFLILFISMLLYWTQVSNFETNGIKGRILSPQITNGKTNPPYSIPTLNPTYSSYSADQSDYYADEETAGGVQTNNHFWTGNSQSIATMSTIIANITLFLLLIFRWKESGHFPLSNLYESLMFLSWSLTLIHLLVEVGFSSTNKNDLEPFTNDLVIDQRKAFITTRLIGSITAPSALFTNAFATFSLPKEMQESAPLVPALQSNWLMMHVTVMMLSYAALILGSLLSIGFLVISGGNGNNQNYSHSQKLNLIATDYAPSIINERQINVEDNLTKSSNLKESYKLNLAKTLDNLSYRILGLGFPLLTIGILSGAVWANEAWGSYWSWDPKETWALLTWLVFAIYLHTRLTKGWEGKKPALIASLGFVTVWICFLGVNLIGEGLHSYGWLSQS